MIEALIISLGVAGIGLAILAVIAMRAVRAGQLAAHAQQYTTSRERLGKLEQKSSRLDTRIKDLESSKQLQGKRIGDMETSLSGITEELKKINLTLQDHRVSITTLMLKVAVVGGIAGTIVPAIMTFAAKTLLQSYQMGG